MISSTHDTKEQPAPAGLQFPCRYPVKAMGRTGDGFEPTIVAIIEKHTGKVDLEDVRSKSTGAGNFQSVTVTIAVASRAELETIYQDLTACEQVLWTL